MSTLTQNTFCLRDTEKVIGLKPSKLNQWLSQNAFIYKPLGSDTWRPKKEKINAGLLELTLVPHPKRIGGNLSQTRVTSLGLTKLKKLHDTA